MDHNAILKAYPNITTLDDSFVDYGLDASGNKVSIVQSNVDAARVELDKLNYRYQRAGIGTNAGYLSISEQFCLLYTSPSPRDGLLSRMPSSA